MQSLSIASYNCKFFDGNTGSPKLQFANEVFNSCDFMCIQEHWLYESQYHRFHLISSDPIDYVASSAMDPSRLRSGRPHGGTAIVWRNSIKHKVTGVDTISPRLSAVIINLDNDVTVLLCTVYMPNDTRNDGANLNEMQDVLAELSIISHKYNAQFLVIIGDFNCDFSRSSPHTIELLNFCNSEVLVPCVNNSCSKIEYTFENSAGARSLIDHCLISKNLEEYLITNETYDSINNGSDHLAVVTRFDMPCDYSSNCVNGKSEGVSWYKAELCDIAKYKNELDSLLDKIVIPEDTLNCMDVSCNKHQNEIECLYQEVVNSACIEASKRALPKCKGGFKGNSRIIPGWNEFIAPKKEKALFHHCQWKMAGSPNSGTLFELRKQSRREYHLAVKRIRKKENVIRSERMAQAIDSSNHRYLWNEVKRLKGKNKVLPMSIDGVKGEEDIAKLFASKYDLLYNSVSFDENRMEKVNKCIDVKLKNISVESSVSCLFSVDETVKAVKGLDKGKSDGRFGLFSDHVINGTKKLYVLITKLYNAMLIHGMSPTDMVSSVMLPIPKNKRLSSKCSANFRAICLQSVLCKILDIMILNRENAKLNTSELQFGFKCKHSTSLAASVMLETVDYYLNNGGNVYGVSLDATKAFDRVEYSRMFELLNDRDVNPLYIRLIKNMYVKQKMCVRYGNVYSEWFAASNGVKQGGVLSPTLFAVYLDGMLRQLERSKVGCYVGAKFCGVVSYADDVIILAPSHTAMCRMITVCEEYANCFCIEFNGSKSKCIVFHNNSDQLICDPKFIVSGQKVPHVSELEYLGYKITADRNDPMVRSVVNDFNCKFNALIGDLNSVSSEVKGNLFKTYCSSLYGGIFCKLYDKSLNKLGTVWRKAQRRLYNLPYTSHCRLLPFICDILPVDVLVNSRFLNHIVSGASHENSVVRYLFKLCIVGTQLSRTGCNLLSLCKKFNLDRYTLQFKSKNEINHTVKDSFFKSVLEDDVLVASQIKALVRVRDCDFNQEFLLNNQEVRNIIEFLCVN